MHRIDGFGNCRARCEVSLIGYTQSIMRPEVGSIVADKYRVERVLGEGGMGVVVAARHVQLEQLVALKFLLPEVAARPDVVERFLREARAAARVQGAHAARVLDVGQDGRGMPYMVMEYLEGEDLDQMLARETKLPVAEAVYCVLQACEALAEAHASRIVHRDLKPANLFLAKQPGGQVVLKVLDFGISKEINSKSHSLTQTAAVMGTPYYMSPEQMRSSKNVDERSDVWALGVILYELITGKLPFAADSLTEVVALILQNEPENVRTLVPEIPEGVALAIEGCLRTNRDDRISDVGVLATMLAPHTDAGDADDHARRATSILENTPENASAPRSSLMQGSRPRKPTSGTLGPTTSEQARAELSGESPAPHSAFARGAVLVGGVAVLASLVFVGFKLTRRHEAVDMPAALAPPPPTVAAVVGASSGGEATPVLLAAPVLPPPDARAPESLLQPLARGAGIAPKPSPKAAAVAPLAPTSPPAAELTEPRKSPGSLRGAGGVL